MSDVVRAKLVWVAKNPSKNRYDSVDAFFVTLPRIGEQVNIEVRARWKHFEGYCEKFSPLHGEVYEIKHMGFTEEYGDKAEVWIYVHVESPPQLTPLDESEITLSFLLSAGVPQSSVNRRGWPPGGTQGVTIGQHAALLSH